MLNWTRGHGVMDKAVACGGNDASDLGSIPPASKGFSNHLVMRLKEETSHDYQQKKIHLAAPSSKVDK